MMWGSRLRWLLIGFVGLPLGIARADMPSPEPYLLVRSMRMLQDQVASGKPEALPMLNRVLGHIAGQLETTKPEVWQKPANAYAILIYLLNGGNPQVVRTILMTTKLESISPKLVAGSLAYADGNPLGIVDNFSGELPPDVPSELVASISLVTAAQLAAIDAPTALKRLDYIRLTAPGTLLEEAALRRGLMMAANLGDKDKVRLLARNYLQRFALSPYSEDFFRQLVDAIMVLKNKISDDEIEEMASLAWTGARLPFYLRIARGAIVVGDMQRARFMSGKAEALAQSLKADDTQARLYFGISNVGTDKTTDAMKMLSELQKDRLHDRDVKLLEAATAMGGSILQQPSVEPMDTPQKSVVKTGSATAGAKVKIDTPKPEPTVDPMIDETRKKLDAIDALLGKAKK
ncbi:chemotaxis protein MotC [Phyllobacterium myrsinacearum]|uniref:Chemotaxis protein MotC n=1 Tax=Phyllobacterium myrsinacearum TaxID=28101 RepID=A0A839ELV0_9HYPH|nr:chemotaxis protein MotC [Phyllobacterium myrsinacearum]